MTLLELKQKANPILLNFWTTLEARQEMYFAKHRKYFQLLVSPTTTVTDGVDSTFIVRKASDEMHIIDVDFTWATKIPFQIEVHEWGNKNEHGYVALVKVKVGLDEYRRERNSKNVDTGWYKYNPLIIT